MGDLLHTYAGNKLTPAEYVASNSHTTTGATANDMLYWNGTKFITGDASTILGLLTTSGKAITNNQNSD